MGIILECVSFDVFVKFFLMFIKGKMLVFFFRCGGKIFLYFSLGFIWRVSIEFRICSELRVYRVTVCGRVGIVFAVLMRRSSLRRGY